MQTRHGGRGARSRGGSGTSPRHLSTGPALVRMVEAICSEKLTVEGDDRSGRCRPPAAAAATRASGTAHVGDRLKRACQSFCTLRVHKAHGRRRLAAGLVVADRHLCPALLQYKTLRARCTTPPTRRARRARASSHRRRSPQPVVQDVAVYAMACLPQGLGSFHTVVWHSIDSDRMEGSIR